MDYTLQADLRAFPFRDLNDKRKSTRRTHTQNIFKYTFTIQKSQSDPSLLESSSRQIRITDDSARSNLILIRIIYFFPIFTERSSIAIRVNVDVNYSRPYLQGSSFLQGRYGTSRDTSRHAISTDRPWDKVYSMSWYSTLLSFDRFD